MALKERQNTQLNMGISRLSPIVLMLNSSLFLQYRGEARPQLNEHYTQHMMEAALKNPTSQNLAFYLATMAPNSGSAGYPPPWSQIPGMPQTTGVWPMPQGIGHYDYNTSAFNVVGGPPAEVARQDGRNESKRVDNRCPPNTARVHVRQ